MKPTRKEVIQAYLEQKLKGKKFCYISSYVIEEEIKPFGKLNYAVNFRFDSYRKSLDDISHEGGTLTLTVTKLEAPEKEELNFKKGYTMYKIEKKSLRITLDCALPSCTETPPTQPDCKRPAGTKDKCYFCGQEVESDKWREHMDVKHNAVNNSLHDEAFAKTYKRGYMV